VAGVEDEYDPGWHILHELAPAVLIYPEAHGTQAEELEAPAVTEYVPAGHVVQAEELDAPAVVEYVPIGHWVQLDELVAPVVEE